MKLAFLKGLGFTLLLNIFNQIQAQPGIENEIFTKAQSQQQAGNFAEALKSYDRLVSMIPTNSVYWYNRGLVKVQLKSYSDAVVDLNKAIYLDTSNVEAYYNRHIAYKFTSNYQFAIADVSRFLTAFPNDPEAHKSRFALTMLMKEYDMAQMDAVWMVRNGIGGDSLKVQLLSIFDAQKKYEDKLKSLNLWINDNPDNSKYYYFRAMTFHQLERFAESNVDVNRFLISEPKNIDALSLKFDNCYFLKDFKMATEIVEELIATDRSNGTYLADYGHVLLQMKQWKDAEKKFTQAIKMKTENLSFVYLGRGIARYNLNKLGLACQDWERSLLMGEKKAESYIKQYCK